MVIKKIKLSKKHFECYKVEMKDNGHKVEIDFPVSNIDDVETIQYINFLKQLFDSDLINCVVAPAFVRGTWSTFWGYWDIEEMDNEYFERFMRMMIDSNVDFEYSGFCEIIDWEKFLELLIDVILNVGGSESLFFYHKDAHYSFYIHYSCAVGIYYKELNDNLRKILSNATKMNCDLIYKDLR